MHPYRSTSARKLALQPEQTHRSRPVPFLSGLVQKKQWSRVESTGLTLRIQYLVELAKHSLGNLRE